MNKWIVDVKGKAGETCIEISVVQEDYTLGIESYGWFNESKLLISQNVNFMGESIKEIVWDKLIKLANEVANELNTIS